MSNPYKIGLTGVIASGKTEVAKILIEKGAGYISADLIGREIMDHHPGMLDWVRETFGDSFFNRERVLIRKKLGDLVFSEPEKKKLLDDKIFPLIYEELRRQIDNYGVRYQVVVVDAAMIFEWGIEKDFDVLITVTAPEEQIRRRLSIRDDFKPEQIDIRLASQIPAEEKFRRADYVIVNDGSLDYLRRQVDIFWEKKVLPELQRKGEA